MGMIPIGPILQPRRGLGDLDRHQRFDHFGSDYIRQRRGNFAQYRPGGDFLRCRVGLGVGVNRRPRFMKRPVPMPFGRGVRFQRPPFDGNHHLRPFAPRFPRFHYPLSPMMQRRGPLSMNLLPSYPSSSLRSRWSSMDHSHLPHTPLYRPRCPYPYPSSEFDDDEDIFGEDQDEWLHSETEDDWGGSDWGDDSYCDDYDSSTYGDAFAGYGRYGGYGSGHNTGPQPYSYRSPYQPQCRYPGW